MNKKLLVLPGDGIGASVTEAVMPVFDKLKLPFEITFADIGWECWKSGGDPVPSNTWDLIRENDAVLLGAITSKPEKEAQQELADHLKDEQLKYVSPVIQLRQKLKLFANVRPVYDLSQDGAFNFCVIRENTEGLYSGFDYRELPNEIQSLLKREATFTDEQLSQASCTIRLQTQAALEKIYDFSFQYATTHNLGRVTLADKPNVLRQSSKMAREIFEETAANYPDITADILNVDAVGLWMVKRPEKFGVIVAENMFADILSDVGAGVMGGLGFAPSANIGDDYAYFEPVHGSAPNVAADKANPCAMFLTIKLLLEHFGYDEQAMRIEAAVKEVITQGKVLSYDLGGSVTTQAMANAIIEHC